MHNLLLCGHLPTTDTKDVTQSGSFCFMIFFTDTCMRSSFTFVIRVALIIHHSMIFLGATALLGSAGICPFRFPHSFG